jgi:hypothetical protein
MRTYDVVIPAAPKDANKVKFLIASARKYLRPQPQNFYVISPVRIDIEGVQWYNDTEVLDLDPNQSRFRRPPWIYQQFLKLFQTISENNQYLIVDSDLIFNREFEVFTADGKKQFFLGVDQNHRQYFNLQQELFGFGRVLNHSFISEVMMFDKVCSQAILAKWDYDVAAFYDAVCDLIGDGTQYLIADYELYGSFCRTHFPHEYALKKIRTHLSGKNSEYTDKDIQDLIDHTTYN